MYAYVHLQMLSWLVNIPIYGKKNERIEVRLLLAQYISEWVN